MSLVQRDAQLYLALGNSFGTTNSQSPGLAIVDVSNPNSPRVLSVWQYPIANRGGGLVAVDGDYAYLGAMGHGVVVLRISDPKDITYISEFRPDRNFPVANQDTLKVNARGMTIRGGYLYLAYDAGGFRVIDIHDPAHLSEVGRYANHDLDHLPRAYNNVALSDTIVYVTTDYCGIEALSITDPQNPYQVSWWNPWNCTSNPLNWFSSPGHTNELAYDDVQKKIFVSTGKSDMYVVDAHDPRHLDSCSTYGGVDNGIGTWGIAAGRENRIYLSYICTAGIPFASNWSGVKILQYSDGAEDVARAAIGRSEEPVAIASTSDALEVPISECAQPHVYVYDQTGRLMQCSWQELDAAMHIRLPRADGLYSIVIVSGRETLRFRYLKLPH
jgi:hypothetical protein